MSMFNYMVMSPVLNTGTLLEVPTSLEEFKARVLAKITPHVEWHCDTFRGLLDIILKYLADVEADFDTIFGRSIFEPTEPISRVTADDPPFGGWYPSSLTRRLVRCARGRSHLPQRCYGRHVVAFEKSYGSLPPSRDKQKTTKDRLRSRLLEDVEIRAKSEQASCLVTTRSLAPELGKTILSENFRYPRGRQKRHCR